jgi:hypothetical protein
MIHQKKSWYKKTMDIFMKSSNRPTRIGGVMVSVLTSIVVDHGFKPKTINWHLLLLPKASSIQ